MAKQAKPGKTKVVKTYNSETRVRQGTTPGGRKYSASRVTNFAQPRRFGGGDSETTKKTEVQGRGAGGTVFRKVSGVESVGGRRRTWGGKKAAQKWGEGATPVDKGPTKAVGAKPKARKKA